MPSVDYYTDPHCPWSWAAEPALRKLFVQFGEELRWTFVMGGMARTFEQDSGPLRACERERIALDWVAAADRGEVPLDPLLWREGPPATSYPACMAVKAAAEQAADAGYAYLRRLREGALCRRRKLDQAEALIEEARSAGLDVERFRLGLRSHATTEAFGADLERAQALAEAQEADGVAEASRGFGNCLLPTLVFKDDDGRERALAGLRPFEQYREAAEAAGAKAQSATPPSVEQLVARFGRVTAREVELVCELQGPRGGAELYRLAEQWKLRPVKCGSSFLWEAA